MGYSPETCEQLRAEYGPGVPIYGCPDMSGDGSGSSTVPTTTSTTTTTTPQSVPGANSLGPLIPVPEDPANHVLAIVLSTTLPTFLLTASIGIGKFCDWLDKNRPNKYTKAKKWLRWIGVGLWVMKKFLEFLGKCKNSDPEAISLNPRGQGQVNQVFSISYNKEE